ncbi:MAG: acyl carrier protein [Thioalkalispiraceae bacterium]|jgi:acyl carrier protein
MSAESKIRSYILDNYLFTDDESELDSNDSFLQKGFIDSTGILEVIFFIEEEFGIKVDDSEMIPENLDSVNNIVNFLEKKMQAA